MQEQMRNLRSSKLEKKDHKLFVSLKRQYTLQQISIDKLEQQTMTPDQIQELISTQNAQIQQKDDLISHYFSELTQLHSQIIQSIQLKSLVIIQQQEELISLTTDHLNTQRLLKQNRSEQQTQTDLFDQKTHQNYSEDQKTEGLLRLIREGTFFYKQQQKINRTLPNIRTIQMYRQQLTRSLNNQSGKQKGDQTHGIE
ncbi:Hypothetical_protein [Hexamita inflata]|uniref:Hypothetical_protein n=1 Tax=Hexamita inflata TaxID=28002 RepID=A0AA86QS85_9EUKA|nr:Hypothetical protein HINF_LOCUS52731 [Hexamita inflata]